VGLAKVTTADPAAWDVATAGMLDVVNAPYGSANYFLSPVPSYKMAGKSGTAQVFTVALTERMRKPGELVEHLRDHALFVAFAPAEAPKIAVAVVVENAPRGGSAFASPLARRIVDTYLLTPAELAEQDAKRKPSKPAPVVSDHE
jgi:penicillin-binding protein 2